MIRALLIAVFAAMPAPAPAQTGYSLDASGRWVAAQGPTLDADAKVIAEARALLADGNAGRAKRILETWTDEHETTDHPLLAEAFLLKGDATTADGNEYDALYDYEEVCLNHPGSPEFPRAVERELEIATRYIHGMRRKWLFGLRITSAYEIGEEFLIRVHERLTGSRLAERALLELGDYYYRERDLKAAADVYEAFVRWYPHSESADLARERRIYSTIARFHGPYFDASSLTDARVLIEDFSKVNAPAAAKAGLSDALVARLDESGAAQLLEKARWYLRRGDGVSARYVLRRLVATHPQTVATRTALKLMDEHGWPAAAAVSPPTSPDPDTAPTAPPPTRPGQTP